MPTHSYLSASVGFNCGARFAGNIPNTTPTVNETANDQNEIGP